jgi:nucleotide-binding universal stress UspA family protein
MRVLIAVEDELFGAACADFVTEHVWQPGTIFKVIHAVEPVFVGDRVTAAYGVDLENEILQDRLSYGRDLVSKVKGLMEQKLPSGMPIETTVSTGRPYQVILDIADIWKADTIVMGSHGRSGWDRVFMGSVSTAVLSHANCSVVIVKLPDRKKGTKGNGAQTTNEETSGSKVGAVKK